MSDQDEQPIRVAFVGQGVYFRHCALESAASGVAPCFIDFRAAAPPRPLLASLQALDPDVVLVFRPEIVPAGLFDGLRAVTIGYLTEPLPRMGSKHHHPDLNERLGWLQDVDPGNFDRVLSFDPLIAETASHVLPVWRSLPIPVADSLYREVHDRCVPPRLLFIGRSTEHREALLRPIKSRHPLIHVGHGLVGEPLQRMLRRADVQFNLHNNPYPTFENRVCIALASGHLVVSEPLSPSHGLRAGVDYLEAHTAEQLLQVVEDLTEDRCAYFDVQHEGRRQAERFRASNVYPDLLRAALDDVRERGGRTELGVERRAAPAELAVSA